MNMEDCFIRKRAGNKCDLKWYSWKLGLITLTDLTANEIELVNWKDYITVEDEHLS